MRGFSSIGLMRPKDKHNVGSVLRAATCYGASMIAVEGERTNVKSIQDTCKTYRHIPVVRPDDLLSACPYGAVPVAVDLIDGAVSLVDFDHPQSAFYIFGPEDGTLSKSISARCAHTVYVPTTRCMNLAATVNVVLYDRLQKQLRETSAPDRAYYQQHAI